MAHPRSRVARVVSTRRLTAWSGLADQGYVNVASGGATIISSIAFNVRGTLIRHRGMVSYRPQAVNADLDMIGAIGVAIVSDQAFAIGVTGVPLPFTNADWGGWMVWRSFSSRWGFNDASGVLYEERSFEVDSKAMRKVRQNETLIFVAESQAGAMAVAEGVRHLVKLS